MDAKRLDLDNAEKLTASIAVYLPECHTQLFAPSPFLHEIKPSPWEALSYNLTSALLGLSVSHQSLEDEVKAKIDLYIQNCLGAVDSLPSLLTSADEPEQDGDHQEATEAAAITLSLVGFLRAISEHAKIWTPAEQLQLIQRLKEVLTEPFLTGVEAAASLIRSSAGPEGSLHSMKRYMKRYAAMGQPVGAMLLQQAFINFVLASTSLLVTSTGDGNPLEQYLSGSNLSRSHEHDVDDQMIEYLVDVITGVLKVLEEGSDYLQLGSSWQQRLALAVKASALEAFTYCMVVDEDIADADVLFSWLDETLVNPAHMADDRLAKVVAHSVAAIAMYIPESASSLARLLLRFIVQGTSQVKAVQVAAESLAYILRLLSQDAIITTLYSLGNVLSSNTAPDKQTIAHSVSPEGKHHSELSSYNNRERAGSVISLSLSGDEETSNVCGNVAKAMVTIARSCNDSKILALTQSQILQKIGKINVFIDTRLIEESAALSVGNQEMEFRGLLRFYSRLNQDSLGTNNHPITEAVLRARIHIAQGLDVSSPLYRIYIVHLLERIITKGDIMEGDEKRGPDTDMASREIMPLVKPLAVLLSRQSTGQTSDGVTERADDELQELFREAWFNMAVHGVTLHSSLGQQYRQDLLVFARYSTALVDDDRAELLESDVDLNTVLRRGMSSKHAIAQKHHLLSKLPNSDSHIRHLSYPQTVFLNATFLVESLRAASGDCSTILKYFLDPALQQSEFGTCLNAVAEQVVRIYCSKLILGNLADFGAPIASRQLALLLVGCCSRMPQVQQVAVLAADRIISQAPSVLCQKSALFALLELLTMMWSGCLEGELDEYEWKSTYTSTKGKITLHLSDDYAFRRRTLNNFLAQARKWIIGIIAIAPLDVKGLLQTYLSEFDDTGAYGHVALGRTFAADMGAVIPPNDTRLTAIDRHGDNAPIDIASDFIAQYTTRQEYRYTGLPHQEHAPLAATRTDSLTQRKVQGRATGLAEEAENILADLAKQTSEWSFSISEIRDPLRRAAALLCRSKMTQSAVVRQLVSIPFDVFDKDSIKFGISLWLGVMNENSRMEARILTEVAIEWEKTIDRKIGIFSDAFTQKDPFYVKEEYAPSDKSVLVRIQHNAQNTISPHLRLLQFFESHFNAIRLGSSNTQRTFLGMLMKTLQGFQLCRGHPLTREIHFHAILFALQVLRWSTVLTKVTMWNLKDTILSAGLNWFRHSPSWSFGGNRLQVKSEIQLITKIQAELQQVQSIGRSEMSNRKPLQARQDLLHYLLENEKSRLTVWLYPLDHEHRSVGVSEASISPLVRVAWNEHPELAVSLVTRFPHESIKRAVRFLLINFPEKAIVAPDGLDLLLGASLPNDVNFQLKYLLYWAPVNPMQAVTYFLPAYGNHPFILQYALRALESHSVDVTFFYVPQIVQSLRYDALGYIEQYIVETGNFSQLFAHQIIWNMKANAYKDEDSQIPDSAKPIFDRVMDKMVSSFTGEDKNFYVREFAFFNEVTDISGKLRPYIKKEKQVKKAKIEEELRKIQVDVGVYLPSNPDGVVVGIDRRSGKPLQSHAKAPYMATFRIRKSRGDDAEDGAMVENAPNSERQRRAKNKSAGSAREVKERAERSNTYEVWQSAIFKVGDDCRQDVLALQMIAAFRGIFNHCGLDVYVYPYRVTATAPGCGVIDVLPNSISRDMLGREAVNGLYEYFVTKYGGEHSIRFQEARANFVKSMAAYSVISYLLQFKDRHNGNIMVDDAGHILHIDFGFIFDIAPGGVKFERAPFKLTNEMIAVMGGSTSAQSYRWFEELTIKAFLASRPYTEKLCHLVSLMLDSGLPCFKPETISNFRKRFVLDRSEREAAEVMRALVRRSEGAMSTKGYDQFQLLTNGIPY